MKRRDFFKLSVLTSSLILAPINIQAKQTKEKTIKTRVAICGAGFAGLSLAKRLKELNPSLDITLIEKRVNFISCPMSNAYLGEVQDISFEDLSFDYYAAASSYNYNFINSTIIDIDIKKKTIITNNEVIQYDYLVMALGISYDYSLLSTNKEKIDELKIKAPAGLKPGSEQLALKRMIKNTKEGNFVIRIPQGSYKCPPAPYERACMIANYFKTNKIKAKVIILDSRDKPGAKSKSFLEAFSKYYKDYIVYEKQTNYKDIDFEKKIIYYEKFNPSSLEYEKKTISFNNASIMPENRSHYLYEKVGIKLNKKNWVSLKQPSFRTVTDDDIYVLGDAQGEYPFPKSAQMANSCAYLVADEINKRINNKTFNYKKNMPGNICYSMINDEVAVSIAHFFTYEKSMTRTSLTSEINKDTATAGVIWYKSLISDILAVEL